MMNTLEREIIEKFHQLQPTAQHRVWTLIEQEISAAQAPFNYVGWSGAVDLLRQEIRTNQDNKQPSIDVVGTLRDIRDGEDE